MKDCSDGNGQTLPGKRCGALARWLVLGALGAVLCACEAPLDLSAVEAQATEPVQRADLFQAAARHGDSVVVVGGMGTIVRSADRGESWQRTRVAGNPFLVDVTACPDGSFHAVDKTDGLWSLDNGGNWERAALPEMTEPQAMTCAAGNTLWVVGGFSTILHSPDAGESWKSWSLDEDLYLTSIQFTDTEHAVATGEFGTVLVSDDAGVSWRRAADLPGEFYPQGAYFADPATGWVVGLDGTIWTTGDGGGSWSRTPSGISTPLYGIAGTDEALVAVGDNTTILFRERGDGSWRQLDETARSLTYLRAVTALDRGRFVVAGGGTLFSVDVLNPGGSAPMGAADE